MQLAHDAGLPSPRVMHVLTPEDELGTGFIMQRIEGETIARKILRDEQFAKARPILARQLGRVIAGIHGLPACEAAEAARDDARQRKSPTSNANTAASTGRARCSNWRCAGCASAIPVRRRR